MITADKPGYIATFHDMPYGAMAGSPLAVLVGDANEVAAFQKATVAPMPTPFKKRPTQTKW